MGQNTSKEQASTSSNQFMSTIPLQVLATHHDQHTGLHAFHAIRSVGPQINLYIDNNLEVLKLR